MGDDTMTTSTTTDPIRVRTSEGVVFVPSEKSPFRVEYLESDFGEVVGCIMNPLWYCAECFAAWCRHYVRVCHADSIYATSIEPLTTASDADYFTYCMTCGFKLDLRYTRNASDDGRRVGWTHGE